MNSPDVWSSSSGEGFAGKLTSVRIPQASSWVQKKTLSWQGQSRHEAELNTSCSPTQTGAPLCKHLTDGFIVGLNILSGRLLGSRLFSSGQKRSKQSNDQGQRLDFMEWAVCLSLSLCPSPSLRLSPAVSDACKRSGRETKKNTARLEKVF